MRDKMMRFMAGRYGNDQLNQFLLAVAVVSIILDMFTRFPLFNILTILCLVWSYFRMFSKNSPARYAENQKFLNLISPLMTRISQGKYRASQMKDFHIYKCPGCGQKIRIPRGKGKISVHCPKCGISFIKRS